jgi:uncharacterized protein YjbJ (UPF0337 family)
MSSGTTDKVKGRVKEAAGALTGDKKLKNEGKADQAIGAVKNAVEKILDKAKDLGKRALSPNNLTIKKSTVQRQRIAQ